MLVDHTAPIRPQPAFLTLGEADLASPVLDIGAGVGDLALHLAASGYDVLGIDADARAVATARARATTSGSAAKFLQLDVFDAPTTGKRFRTVVDSGFFHTLGDDARAQLAGTLASIIAPGGVYHVLGFSEVSPGDRGTTPLDERQLALVFRDRWRISQVRDTTWIPAWNPDGVRAVLASLVRST